MNNPEVIGNQETSMNVERDTNSDYDLIHSREGLVEKLVWGVGKIEGCSLEIARFALLQPPQLAIDIDYNPASDTGWTEVLERTFGQLLGERDDVRIAGMRIAPDYSIVQLGLAYPAFDLETMQIPDLTTDFNIQPHSIIENIWDPDRIVDLKSERAFSTRVFLNHQTGRAYIPFLTLKDYFTNNTEESKREDETEFPPKILVAFANIVDQESVYRMNLAVSRPGELKRLNTPKVSVQMV